MTETDFRLSEGGDRYPVLSRIALHKLGHTRIGADANKSYKSATLGKNSRSSNTIRAHRIDKW